MRVLNFILIVLILPLAVLAQDIEIFGYFEPQLMVAKIKDDLVQMSSNKLRVDLKYQPGEQFTFGANFDYITYHGKTKWDILEYLPENVVNEASQINFLGYEVNPYLYPYENRQFLDNAYLKISFKRADVTIGKQQISLGTGYVWNPTDVFNKKEIIDPTYEQPGHNAFRLDVPIKGNWGFTALYAPTDDWKYSDLLIKLQGNLLHFDFSILGIQKNWNFTDARIFDFINMNFYQLNTKRHILGADFAGEILGIGVWGEYARNWIKIDNDIWNDYLTHFNQFYFQSGGEVPQLMSIKKDYQEWVLGFDYTFDFQTYVMCEFYRNTFAKADEHQYNFNDWMHYFLAETKTITQDQLYLFIQHPLTDLINIRCSGIYSMSDGSAGMVPMITYNIFENVDLTAIGNYFFGKQGTAYAENLGNGGILRARVYF